MRQTYVNLPILLLLMSYHVFYHICSGFRSDELKERVTRSSDQNTLNEYIFSLNYSNDAALVYKGESARDVKTEGFFDDDRKFIVISPVRKNISNAKADIGVLSGSDHITFPGSLLLANSHLLDNTPDYISIDRASIEYTVNLPGMRSDGNFKITPTFGDYKSAIEGALNTWFEKYEADHPVNAEFQSDYCFAYSKEQLRVKFGQEFKNSIIESNLDLSEVEKQEKIIFIQKFQQIYYTVGVQSPKTPSELFSDGVTREELADKFDDKNPPVMVKNANYGRLIYVIIETSSTDKKSKTLMETKLTKLNLTADSESDYTRQLKNFNMQVFVMGGGSDQINLLNAKNMKDVNNIIVKYKRFSRENSGYLVSYSTEFIKDNSKAIVNSYAEYTEITRTEQEKGLIKIKHTGLYVSQWNVEWDEVSYDKNGNKTVKRKGWDKNWYDLTAPFNEVIQLEGNCGNISVLAREATGLIWNWWRTVINRSNIPLIKERTFAISGTTINPKFSIVPAL